MLQTKFSLLTTVLILWSNLLTSIVMWKLVGQVSECRRKDDPQRNLNESENGSLGRVTVVSLDETSPLFPHLTSETTHFRNALSKILNFPIQLIVDSFLFPSLDLKIQFAVTNEKITPVRLTLSKRLVKTTVTSCEHFLIMAVVLYSIYMNMLIKKNIRYIVRLSGVFKHIRPMKGSGGPVPFKFLLALNFNIFMASNINTALVICHHLLHEKQKQ